MATYQTEVDALLLAIFTAEDAATPSKTLANNANASMHNKQFAKDFLKEFLLGVKDSATYNGAAILEELKLRFTEIYDETVNTDQMSKKFKPRNKAEEAANDEAGKRLKAQTATHGTAEDNVKATEKGAAERKKSAK